MKIRLSLLYVKTRPQQTNIGILGLVISNDCVIVKIRPHWLNMKIRPQYHVKLLPHYVWKLGLEELREFVLFFCWNFCVVLFFHSVFPCCSQEEPITPRERDLSVLVTPAEGVEEWYLSYLIYHFILKLMLSRLCSHNCFPFQRLCSQYIGTSTASRLMSTTTTYPLPNEGHKHKPPRAIYFTGGKAFSIWPEERLLPTSYNNISSLSLFRLDLIIFFRWKFLLLAMWGRNVSQRNVWAVSWRLFVFNRGLSGIHNGHLT